MQVWCERALKLNSFLSTRFEPNPPMLLLFFFQNGDKSRAPGEFECPYGWMWEDDAWSYDDNRAVDEIGMTPN